MNRKQLKRIIQEAVSHRIKVIDEAGNVAANEAKINKLTQEIEKANKVNNILEKLNLPYYIGENLYNKLKQEMETSLTEFNDAKQLLEGGKKGKDEDKDEDKEILENE
jgi:predicted proteasome-type protease